MFLHWISTRKAMNLHSSCSHGPHSVLVYINTSSGDICMLLGNPVALINKRDADPTFRLSLTNSTGTRSARTEARVQEHGDGIQLTGLRAVSQQGGQRLEQ